MCVGSASRETIAGAVAANLTDIVGAPEIDFDTGFFDLGANSLDLTELVGRLRMRWPELRIIHVFAHPTVNSLAVLLATLPEAAQDQPQRNAGGA